MDRWYGGCHVNLAYTVSLYCLNSSSKIHIGSWGGRMLKGACRLRASGLTLATLSGLAALQQMCH